MQLSGNTVLITGGATGTGYVMAEAFLDTGSTVAIRGRTKHASRGARETSRSSHTRLRRI